MPRYSLFGLLAAEEVLVEPESAVFLCQTVNPENYIPNAIFIPTGGAANRMPRNFVTSSEALKVPWTFAYPRSTIGDGAANAKQTRQDATVRTEANCSMNDRSICSNGRIC